MAATLIERVRELLIDATNQLREPGIVADLRAATARLDEPLRVAIAGKVKAGKSTLLNALIGEELAPTDAGECTRIVTWYRGGTSHRVVVRPNEGQPFQVPFRRTAGFIEPELGDLTPAQISALEVTWASPRLRAVTLIDTPGIASIDHATSERTARALTPDEDRPAAADAVIYLMRHLHVTDLRFLESFHDDEFSQATPINAVGVLSRADEVGACRLTAMDAATRVANRYKTDPKVRRLCQSVLPVSGLVAQAGETLLENEFRALAAIAAGDRHQTTELLLSADRFTRPLTTVEVTELDRAHLLDRLGIFGVRLAIDLLWRRQAQNTDQLGERLIEASGVARLRSLLTTQFTERSDVLKARTALATLDATLHRVRGDDVTELEERLHRLLLGAHEFAELRLLNQLRIGTVTFPGVQPAEAERLLGGDGTSVHRRLGLAADVEGVEVAAVANQARARWKRVAEHPLSTRDLREAASTVVRTLEGIVAQTGAPSVPAPPALPQP